MTPYCAQCGDAELGRSHRCEEPGLAVQGAKQTRMQFQRCVIGATTGASGGRAGAHSAAFRVHQARQVLVGM